MSINIAIKLPAKVNDIEKALEMIGGVDHIAKVSHSDLLTPSNAASQMDRAETQQGPQTGPDSNARTKE